MTPQARAQNPRSPPPPPSPISPGVGVGVPPPICRGSGVHPHPHPRFAGDRGSTPTPTPDLPESGVHPHPRFKSGVPGPCPGPCPDSLSLRELPPSAVLGSIGVPALPWPDDSLLEGCRASILELAFRVRERLSPGPAQMRQCGRGESVPARMWQGGIAHHHPSWGCYLGLGRSHLPEASFTHGPGLQKLTFTRPTKSEPSPQE